ncbi:hypothetical protein JL720_12648 [Aureococcus anophagefferens]|nr:hypothetical protein JL720_12648 [Aureococcus anophagefferens]
MSNAVRDAMEAQLRRDATLGASVDALFRCVPAHLVPVDEQMSKAQVIVDRPSFRALAARLLDRPAPAGAADNAFDGLDVDGVSVLSVAEIAIRSAARRRAASATRPSPTRASGSRRSSAPSSPATARSCRASRYAWRSSASALGAAEFHRLALRALHLPLARDVSDALFSSIAGASPSSPSRPSSPRRCRGLRGRRAALATVVKVFATADPKGRVSHLEGDGQRRISRDEFRHVLARILMIPCGADSATPSSRRAPKPAART